MLKTPVTLELVRRCFGSRGGDEEIPSIAESTFVKGEVISIDMMLSSEQATKVVVNGLLVRCRSSLATTVVWKLYVSKREDQSID